MSESPETLEIAVGIVLDEERQNLLLTWNDKWGGFSLPMTKIKADRFHRESAEQAAARAVADVLQLPTRLNKGASAQREHCLLVSQRDEELKGYNYHLVQVEIHPEFRSVNRVHRPVLWVPVPKLAGEEIQPLTWSVKPILDKCRELEWI